MDAARRPERMDGKARAGRVRWGRAAALAAAVGIGLALVLWSRMPTVARAFDPADPPDELRLCRVYGRSAVHASPLPSAPVVEPGSPAMERIETSSIGEPACPFVFEVRTGPDEYVQYTGRGGP